MAQNSNNNAKTKSNSNNNSKPKSNNNSSVKKPQGQQVKPQGQQVKPQGQQVKPSTEQDGGLKFFDKIKNKYADWKTRRTIIKEAEAKADKAVALNKFNRLKTQYGFKGGDK
jgi:hypothetical protein